MTVQFPSGKIRVHLPKGQGAELGSGDILALEHGLTHDVEALEESAFLLTISWPGSESEEDR